MRRTKPYSEARRDVGKFDGQSRFHGLVHVSEVASPALIDAPSAVRILNGQGDLAIVTIV